jgi:hypothetical protein
MEDFNYETISSIWKKAHFNNFEKIKKQVQKKLEKAAKRGKKTVDIPVKNIGEATEIRNWLQSLEFCISSNNWDSFLRIYLDRKKGD